MINETYQTFSDLKGLNVFNKKIFLLHYLKVPKKEEVNFGCEMEIFNRIIYLCRLQLIQNVIKVVIERNDDSSNH
ncbi:hypothetical protein BpHYR1_002762 [Brachionus plicatilis]|uniref:Uncharacterized protein n=1 Tax=Brachionus plicatilis TaxID=10195 RepID=A0A3M7SZT9_BRAPC|nr:hypothetical protein BpHYR1_002762 [Brachionus plicatilis]